VDLALIFMVLMACRCSPTLVLDGTTRRGHAHAAANAAEQSVMVSSIGPSGTRTRPGSSWAWDPPDAFPAAHGVVLGALYLPWWRCSWGSCSAAWRSNCRMKALGWHRELWNWLLLGRSFLGLVLAGFMLGRYITGFERVRVSFSRDAVGAGVCGGYVLLGARGWC